MTSSLSRVDPNRVVRPGTRSIPPTTEDGVVVRAQPQRGVRRAGAGHACDDPHLLPVRVLPGEPLGVLDVVGYGAVSVRGQHQPLHDGRAAGDLRAAR